MEEINVDAVRSTVLWATFAVGLLFGAVSHRSHFCTMGAVADIVNFGDWNRMRMWLLAIAVAALGLQFMGALGMVNLSDTIYLGTQWSWLSMVIGGFLFGVGMVFASGCGSKTLIRLGGGNLKALVVFAVLGLTSYMTLKGVFGVFRANVLDPVRIEFDSNPYLPQMLADLAGLAANASVINGLALALPVALIVAVLAKKEAWTKEVLLGGLGVGSTIVAAWWVVFALAYVPEHPETLEAAYLGSYANRAEGFSFVAPYAYTLEWLMFFSDVSRVLTVGIVACFGVILGALISSLADKSFRWEGFQGPEDTANHLAGAALMGIGGVMALGCTVGQGLSGVSTLSLTSFVALASILAGAWAALKYQTWRVMRMV